MKQRSKQRPTSRKRRPSVAVGQRSSDVSSKTNHSDLKTKNKLENEAYVKSEALLTHHQLQLNPEYKLIF